MENKQTLIIIQKKIDNLLTTLFSTNQLMKITMREILIIVNRNYIRHY